jgi:hypothetical protein
MHLIIKSRRVQKEREKASNTQILYYFAFAVSLGRVSLVTDSSKTDTFPLIHIAHTPPLLLSLFIYTFWLSFITLYSLALPAYHSESILPLSCFAWTLGTACRSNTPDASYAVVPTLAAFY